jgi:tetratricopeptide (TPR) repeat protein
LAFLSTFPANAEPLEAQFRNAQEAYDDGRHAEAVLIYQDMVSNGVSNAEVHYNLANALFKDNDLPNAIMHYRKAWYQRPRDPDIQANFHFAMNASGAAELEIGFIKRTLQTLSLSEWLMAAIAGYVILTILLGMAQWIKPARRLLLKLSLVPILLILLSSAGWYQWYNLQLNPEWVVVKSGGTALFGPVEGSTAHYKLPLGALVQQKSTDHKGWVEIQYDKKTGWIKEEYIELVSP